MSIEIDQAMSFSIDSIKFLDDNALDNLSEQEVQHFKFEVREKKLEFDPLQSFSPEDNTIIIEGDSWCDYPVGTDLVDWLRSEDYDYHVINHAKAGDTLENMIYGSTIDRDMNRLSSSLSLILQQIAQKKPKAFVFSGGGNDIAGDEFFNYLNHHDTGFPTINEHYATHMVNFVFKKYLIDLINAVHRASPQTQIIMHGYGYTVPTGKGVNILFFKFAGPWLLPALKRKGITDKQEQRKAVFYMIDLYNNMLEELDQKFPTFHYVNLRPHLNPDRDWRDELHLSNSKFRMAARFIHEKIKQVT